MSHESGWYMAACYSCLPRGRPWERPSFGASFIAVAAHLASTRRWGTRSRCSLQHSAQHCNIRYADLAADISGVLGPGHGTAAGGVGTCCCCFARAHAGEEEVGPRGEESELLLVVLAARWAACKGPALERTDRRAIRAGRPMTAGRLGRVHRCVRACVFLPRGWPRAAGAASLVARA